MRFGGIQVSGEDAQDSVRVVQELPHPLYDPITDTYDVMVLQLERPSTQPTIQWNTMPNVNVGDFVSVAGFGAISFGSGEVTDLREVKIQVVDPELCEASFGSYDNDIMICAFANGKDTCQGDSGGSLLDDNNVIVGIVSFGGIGCGDSLNPGVYARVSAADYFIRLSICELASTEIPSECDTLTSYPTRSPVAAPPTPLISNDNCVDAIVVETSTETIGGSTVGATSDGITTCFTLTDGSTAGVWYRLIGDGSTLSASLDGRANTLAVFSGTCEAPVCIDFGIDITTFQPKAVTWESEVGETYLIYVSVLIVLGDL